MVSPRMSWKTVKQVSFISKLIGDGQFGSDGLEGFESFLRDIKEYDRVIPMVEEEIYTSLQDHDIAIHPDHIGAEKQNWLQTLRSLKHLGFDIKSGKMDVFGKVVFEIPNMEKNFKEMQKIFPACQHILQLRIHPSIWKYLVTRRNG